MGKNQAEKRFYNWIAERTATPTYKRAQPHNDKAILANIEALSGEVGAPNMELLLHATLEAIRACNAVANADDNIEGWAAAEEDVRAAFFLLQSIVELNADMAVLAQAVAQMMTSAWRGVSQNLVEAQVDREIPAIRPIARINAAKAAAIERAQAIAIELWQTDTAQEIRIGEMAERIYRTLAAEGFIGALPDTAERIKEWIRPTAPDYARKGGRRRKSS